MCRQLGSCNRIKYILLLYHTMGSCTGTALCRSLQANTPCCAAHRCCTTVLHTQVLEHCTAHNGAVPQYCTQVMYTCNAHVIAATMYCTHRCCTSTKYAPEP